MDPAVAKTPGFSSTLEAKRDIFGQKIQAQAGYPQSAFNLFTVTKGNDDPVLKQLARLAQSDAQSQFSTPSEHVGKVDLTQFKKSSGQSAYDRWLELSGYGLREAFMQRMQSASYQNASDGNSWYTASSRAHLLREIQHRFQDKAMMQVRREYPELEAAMLADKQNKMDVRTGRSPRNQMEKILDFGK